MKRSLQLDLSGIVNSESDRMRGRLDLEGGILSSNGSYHSDHKTNHDSEIMTKLQQNR